MKEVKTLKVSTEDAPIIGALPPKGVSVDSPRFVVYAADDNKQPVARAYRWPAARDYVQAHGGRIWDSLDNEWLD